MVLVAVRVLGECESGEILQLERGEEECQTVRPEDGSVQLSDNSGQGRSLPTIQPPSLSWPINININNLESVFFSKNQKSFQQKQNIFLLSN